MQEDPRLSIKDMLLYCLLHWRSALVLACVVGLACGGYQAATYKREPSAATAEASADVLYEEKVAKRREVLEAQRTYLENSLYLRLNPDEVHIARAVVELGIDGQTPVDTLQLLYQSYVDKVQNGPAVAKLAEQIGTTTTYMREVIGIWESVSGASRSQADESATVTTVVIQGLGTSSEEAAARRDAALENLWSAHEELSETIGAHTLRVVSMPEYTYIDRGIANAKADIVNVIAGAQAALANEEAAVATAVAEEEEAPGRKQVTVESAVIGGAVALTLYLLVLCLRYTLGKRPFTREQLARRYRVPEPGSFAEGAPALYRGATRLDRWLRQEAGLHEAKDVADVAAMVAASAGLYAPEARCVLVSSSIGSARSQELADALRTATEGLRFLHADRTETSAPARTCLEEADAVVFVEEYGKSPYASIDAELEIALNAGKVPLGFVMA